MNKEELANYYVQKIKKSSSKIPVVKNIMNEINNLVYSETKNPISTSDKIWMLEYTHEQLSSNFTLSYIEKSADNKYYLTLIREALERLNGGKK